VSARPQRLRALAGLGFAVAFAAVGALFLAVPGGVLAFADGLSRRAGLAGFPAAGDRFWLVLAGAYMYVVTVLAWGMWRHPDDPAHPRLLAHAKLASAGLSVAAFIIYLPHLVFLANGAVDGAIGLAALALARQARRDLPPTP